MADTSLIYDRDFKRRLYARAGIPKVWIVNRGTEQIEVYREPDGDIDRSIVLIERGGAVTPLAFPDLTIQVNDILG